MIRNAYGLFLCKPWTMINLTQDQLNRLLFWDLPFLSHPLPPRKGGPHIHKYFLMTRGT